MNVSTFLSGFATNQGIGAFELVATNSFLSIYEWIAKNLWSWFICLVSQFRREGNGSEFCLFATWELVTVREIVAQRVICEQQSSVWCSPVDRLSAGYFGLLHKWLLRIPPEEKRIEGLITQKVVSDEERIVWEAVFELKHRHWCQWCLLQDDLNAGRMVLAFRGTAIDGTEAGRADVCADGILWDDTPSFFEPENCSQFSSDTLDYYKQAVDYTKQVTTF